MIVNLTASSIAVLATASRQLWAFARNRGLPGSTWLAPNVLPGDIPLGAIIVSICVTICLSLINIGSSAALNAIFSLNTGSLITSYLITIGCLVLRRLRGQPLPTARFSLGKWGLPINLFAIAYLIPVFVFSFFPGTPDPTPQTMNWGVLMYGVIVIFATLYYIVRGKHHYLPPSEDVKNATVEQADSFYDNHENYEVEAEPETVHEMGERVKQA
jgi:amino acid transporter